MPKESFEETAIDAVEQHANNESMASIVAAAVTQTLSQLGVGPVNPTAKRIAELALLVLDGCGIELRNSLIEIQGGTIVNDMMTTRAYQELLRTAGELGVTQERVSTMVNDAWDEYQDEVKRQVSSEGLQDRGFFDRSMGPEDADRKGILR